MKLQLLVVFFNVALLSAAARSIFMEPGASRVVGKEWNVQSNSAKIQKIELTFALKLSNADKLHDKLMDVSSPKSSNYGKLMTLKEVNDFTRPSDEAVKTVSEFLESFGLGKGDYTQSNGFIRALVDVELAEKMLSAKYQTFEHEGTKQVAVRCKEYSLDERVAQHVDFVAPTVNFPRPFDIAAAGEDDNGDANVNTPESLRELYSVGDAMGGKSNTRQGKDVRIFMIAFLNLRYSSHL